VAPCNLVVSYQCSKGTCCLHLKQVQVETASARAAELGIAMLAEGSVLLLKWSTPPKQEMTDWQCHQFPDDEDRNFRQNVILLAVQQHDTAASPKIFY